MISYQVHVNKRLLVRTRADLEEQAGKLVRAIAEHGKEDIKANYTTDHVPSAPGEPPAVRTGALRRSTVTETQNALRTGIAKILIGEYYAEFLEFGTERIAPRPFVRPAVERLVGEVANIAEKEDFLK